MRPTSPGTPVAGRDPLPSAAVTVKELTDKQYEKELLRLQTELVYLQEWIVAGGRRLVVLFEGATPPARAGRSSALTPTLTPAPAASSRCPRRASERARSGTSSATPSAFPRPGKSLCSTAAGTTARASST